MPHTPFVFHDPTGKRWARVRRSVRTAALLLAIGIVLFVLAFFSNPQLPSLGIPPVAHLPAFSEVHSIIRGDRAEKNVPFEMRREARRIRYVRSSSPVLHPKTAARTGAGRPLVFGYYVNWDPASMVSLRLHLSHLTHLVPEWLTLANGKGDLADTSDPTVIQIANEAHLPILAMVTNFRDGWQKSDLHAVLNDPGARADLIQNIRDNLAEHKLAGVNIDFEQLDRRDRGALAGFMAALRDNLKPGGYIVTESVPADDNAYDLKRLAAAVDYLVPMVYDEHYQSGTPGPVASEQWFEEALDKLARQVPPEKMVVGFGNYGYDWIIGATGGAETGYGGVMAAANGSAGAKIEWSADTANPVLHYTAEGRRHEVWFLDAVTGLNQVQAASDYGYAGVGLWRLGAEDPGLWRVLKREQWPDENFDPSRLAVLPGQKNVNQYGEGEIIRVTATPRNGSRDVWRGNDEIYAENYRQLPSYYVIESAASRGNHVLALTFDDGPDPKYTPAILDVLKSRKVPAAFFVVGANAEKWPSIVGREYADGHEVGNHTYSHPNIAATSDGRTRLELSATQRIIENITGHSTTLFRPPYNADSEPQTPEEIDPLVRAQADGYITVGERIDPRDWEPGVNAGAILNEVRDEIDNGSIILLHDGGGDRSATAAALPHIIDECRARGYRFVLVSELLGKTRAQVMPPPSAEELRWARIEGQGFNFQGALKRLAGTLFLWAIILTATRSVVFGALALWQKRGARRRMFDAAYLPPVSVIIAAYNEEKVIRKTVASILGNGYPSLEVVVVDDGSKDETLGVLQEAFGDDSRVRILSQANTGKAGALNRAVANASHDILVALDADTIFAPGTIAKLVRHFADPRVGAVSGNARVGNRRNWITRFQSIEYIYGFNLDRRALDALNAITVVPGAAGAWRKSLVTDAGGFGHETLAEDTDLTLKIRRMGYRIVYDEQAVAWTEAPEDTRSLARQRFRWAFGTLQAAWKHRDATFDPRFGALGLVALPAIWIFQVLLAALSPFADIAMIASLVAGNWRTVLAYYFGFFLLEMLAGAMAYALEGANPKDLRLLFFQRIYYRGLMLFVMLKSLLFATQGRLVGWGKLERRATVEAEA